MACDPKRSSAAPCLVPFAGAAGASAAATQAAASPAWVTAQLVALENACNITEDMTAAGYEAGFSFGCLPHMTRLLPPLTRLLTTSHRPPPRPSRAAPPCRAA